MLYCLCYTRRLSIKSIGEALVCEGSAEQCFSYDIVYYAIREVLTAKSIDEILVCDHSNESYREVVSCGTVSLIMLHKVVQILQSLDETLVCGHLNESCFGHLFHVV